MGNQLTQELTAPYKWRTVSDSKKVFVDSNFGDDATGDGSQMKPFKTLTRGSLTEKMYIICRGRFSEDMSTGKHSLYILGDYLGAAVFDGAETYLIYGYAHSNMIIMNCPEGNASTQTHIKSGLLAGCGRASYAGLVGLASHAYNVYGLFGSSNIIINSSIYFGAIANYDPIGIKNVYAKLKVSEKEASAQDSLIWFGNTKNGTVYDIPITKRAIKYYIYENSLLQNMLYSKVGMIANNPKTIYLNCFFAGDVEWYIFSKSTLGTTYLSTDIKLNITEEDIKMLNKTPDLTAYFKKLIDELKSPDISIPDNAYPIFKDCKFSNQIDKLIFNNPYKDDYTLKASLDSDKTNNEAILNNGSYYGALPPAINIPIYASNNPSEIKSASDMKLNCWDNQSISGGLISVEADPARLATDQNVYGSIVLDDVSQPSSNIGIIYSKIITLDPRVLQISGIFSNYVSLFIQKNVYLNDLIKVYLNEDGTTKLFGDKALVGEDVVVEKGTYIVMKKDKETASPGITYYGYNSETSLEVTNQIFPGHCFFVSDEDIQGLIHKFRKSDDNVLIAKIKDPNIMNVCYCRCRAMVYNQTSSGKLKKNGVYLNNGGKSINYNGRTIINGESFIAKNDNDTFTVLENYVNSNDYKVSGIFGYDNSSDDQWVPAQLMGEYFVSKVSGNIETDEEGIPLGSGNYKSYGKLISKTIINQIYVQFKIVVKKWLN